MLRTLTTDATDQATDDVDRERKQSSCDRFAEKCSSSKSTSDFFIRKTLNSILYSDNWRGESIDPACPCYRPWHLSFDRENSRQKYRSSYPSSSAKITEEYLKTDCHPTIYTSVQAENENFSDPTFLDPFDLRFHMPGHFLL